MASVRSILLVAPLLLAACGGTGGDDGQLAPDGGTISDGRGSDAPPDAPPAPLCGDGVRGLSEGCDDGNTNSYDGCSASCYVEADCTCTGAPSTCTCTPPATTTTQTITTSTDAIDTASLVLDGTGAPHVTWYYGINFTDPVTGYSREHGHAMYADRSGGTSWTTSEIQTWDQTQTIMSRKDFSLAYDGAVRTFFHRIYATGDTLEVGTRTGSSWTFATSNPTYSYDAMRAGGNWHALVGTTAFYDLHYMMGEPGAWTRDETLSGISSSNYPRLAATNGGDVYITQAVSGTNHTSYNIKLSKRLNGFTWDTAFDVATTGTCVYPASHTPLVLSDNELMTIEDGFNGSAQRWLRAHRLVNGSWTTETIADLSWYGYTPTCSTSSASWTTLPMAIAADALGQPHVVYIGSPWNNSTTIEDHYRDASGWHVRSYPFAKAMPLALAFDASGTAHILVTTPGSTSGTTRLVYLRINTQSWTSL